LRLNPLERNLAIAPLVTFRSGWYELSENPEITFFAQRYLEGFPETPDETGPSWGRPEIPSIERAEAYTYRGTM